MRKPVILAATVVFISLLAFPQGAFADDESDEGDSWELIFGTEHDDQGDIVLIRPESPEKPPKPDQDHKHKTLNDHYDEVGEVGVPLILIRPDIRPNSETYELPILPLTVIPNPEIFQLGEVEDMTSSSDEVEEIQELVATKLGITLQGQYEAIAMLPSAITPSTGAPIEIKDLVLTTKTPADEFLDVAFLFGAGLGGLAIGLVGVTGVSALKLRREAKLR